MPYDINEMSGKIFTITEVAEMLGIGVDAVRRRVREGLLPARRPPGRVGMVFLGDDLVKVLLGEAVAVPPPKKEAPRRLKGALATSKPEATPGLFDATPGAEIPARKPPTPPPGEVTAIPANLPAEAGLRLAKVADDVGMTPKEMVEATGIERTVLSRFLNGGRGLSKANAFKLRDAFGGALISYLLGDGPKPDKLGR